VKRIGYGSITEVRTVVDATMRRTEWPSAKRPPSFGRGIDFQVGIVGAFQESDAGLSVAVGVFFSDIKNLAATHHLRGRN
jgi:hypothetical protein